MFSFCSDVEVFGHVIKRSWLYKCPVNKLHSGGLQRPHSADHVAINWRKGTAMKDL